MRVVGWLLLVLGCDLRAVCWAHTAATVIAFDNLRPEGLAAAGPSGQSGGCPRAAFAFPRGGSRRRAPPAHQCEETRVTTSDTQLQALERLKHCMDSYNQHHTVLLIHISFGVATGEKGTQLETVLHEADSRMYAVKREKKEKQERGN